MNTISYFWIWTKYINSCHMEEWTHSDCPHLIESKLNVEYCNCNYMMQLWWFNTKKSTLFNMNNKSPNARMNFYHNPHNCIHLQWRSTSLLTKLKQTNKPYRQVFSQTPFSKPDSLVDEGSPVLLSDTKHSLARPGPHPGVTRRVVVVL